MQPEIGFHEIDKWAKEKAQGSHGYAVLRWFYAVYQTEVDGINSAHTSSTRGSRGCPPGTLPCLQGIVCYTCRPQGYGNGGARCGKASSTTGWEKAPGLAGMQSQGRPPNSMVHTRTILSVLPLTLVGLPPRREVGVFRGEGGRDFILEARVSSSGKPINGVGTNAQMEKLQKSTFFIVQILP